MNDLNINDLSEDQLLIQHLANVRVNMLKEIIEGYGEGYLGVTDRKILYENNDENSDLIVDGVLDNTTGSIVEMIKNHLTNGRTSLNPGLDYDGGDDGSEPYVAPYVPPDGKWDINRSVAWINANSGPKSKHCCAKYVRMAMEAGGISTAGRPGSAYLYTGYLPKIGFEHIATLSTRKEQNSFSSSSAQPGDIAVMSHGKHGHICMWNGSQWVSDFKQNNMWVYSGEGVCRIFRYKA